MKAGTIIRLLDGREGTVVYSGLDGYGIRWGRLDVDIEKILEGNGGVCGNAPENYPPELWPEAMLRDPYPSADLPCVGGEFEGITQ